MKNINFHSLKNTPVPEELKKSVIAVPERSGTKRKVYPGRMIRFAVAAAFLAVITAVSVPLFMNIANAPIPVIPAATEGAQAPSGHTEKPSQPTATEPADPTRPPSAEKATAKIYPMSRLSLSSCLRYPPKLPHSPRRLLRFPRSRPRSLPQRNWKRNHRILPP